MAGMIGAHWLLPKAYAAVRPRLPGVSRAMLDPTFNYDDAAKARELRDQIMLQMMPGGPEVMQQPEYRATPGPPPPYSSYVRPMMLGRPTLAGHRAVLNTGR